VSDGREGLPVAETAATAEHEQRRLRNMGQRLKNLRRVRGLSLQEVADGVGVSPSFLSMLERGQTDISLSRVSRLADFYGVYLSELLLDGDVQLLPPVVETITGIATIDRGKGVLYRVIKREHPQVMHVLMAPRSSFPDLRAHQGEDFWIVLRGRPELLYGPHRYPFVAPQTARFAGVVEHGWDNPGSEEAELIAIASVPYW
jgi:transcriptional regulator with XRE-family HTH domain